MIAGRGRKSARETVELLLRISSFDHLVESILSRAVLPGGRFEAHEFGRQEHSTASGAGILVGFGAVPEVADTFIGEIVAALAAYIGADGNVVGHDPTQYARPTSWREAQVLLGILTRPSLAISFDSKIRALAARLQQAQDVRSGGWPLRSGEETRLIFAFYPAIALARAWQRGLLDRSDGEKTLRRLESYLSQALADESNSLEERLLAVRALRTVQHVLPAGAGMASGVNALSRTLQEQAWVPPRGLALVDRPVVVYPQPTWHAIIWRPLLYLALRGSSPLSPVLASLGHELVSTYDTAVSAWHGPQGTTAQGTGASWASALAFRATYALAQDLNSWEITVDEWRSRCEDLRPAEYEFDVAISFAGANRDVASEVSEAIKGAGYRVFYDRDYQHVLLGEDLTQYLQETYSRKSRFAVVIVSRAFRESKWAGNWEWKAVLARMQDQRGPYLLPYVIEDVEIPGLNKTLGYVSQRDYSPAEFAALVIRKLRASGRKVGFDAQWIPIPEE